MRLPLLLFVSRNHPSVFSEWVSMFEYDAGALRDRVVERVGRAGWSVFGAAQCADQLVVSLYRVFQSSFDDVVSHYGSDMGKDNVGGSIDRVGRSVFHVVRCEDDGGESADKPGGTQDRANPSMHPVSGRAQAPKQAKDSAASRAASGAAIRRAHGAQKFPCPPLPLSSGLERFLEPGGGPHDAPGRWLFTPSCFMLAPGCGWRDF